MTASSFSWAVDGSIGQQGIELAPQAPISDKDLALAANVMVALRKARLPVGAAEHRIIASLIASICAHSHDGSASMGGL